MNWHFFNSSFKRLPSSLMNSSSVGSVMKAKLNPVTGKAEWCLKPSDYDFEQEIARSGYADMLHDHERNEAFIKGLESVIKRVKLLGKRAHVLDIGTGTGLLAMAAARFGADKVTACEAFEPIASIAERIIAENGLSDKVKVICSRSTDLEKNSIKERANICVGELFDTELIGEGALRSFREAHEHLLESDTVMLWNRVSPINTPDAQIVPPRACSSCPGAASVHDVQLDQVPRHSFVALSDPIPVFHFDFNNPSTLIFDEHKSLSVNCQFPQTNARVDAVLMWWVLDMDGTGEIMLSTEPNWTKEKPSQWRDHWMQAIYYFPDSVVLNKDCPTFTLHASHDEHSLWFSGSSKGTETTSPERPVCSCGVHLACSREYLGRLNDNVRRSLWIDSLREVVQNKSCLSISDVSLLPLIAANCGASKVISVEQSGSVANNLMRSFVCENNLDDKITFTGSLDALSAEQPNLSVDVVFGDPSFLNSLLPWDNLYFYNAVWKLISSKKLSESVKVLPQVYKKAIQKTDEPLEPQPVWEYPCKLLGSPKMLTEFSFAQWNSKPGELLLKTSCTVDVSGHFNAVVLWMEWSLDHLRTISTGLKADLTWDMYSRQGVFFLPDPYKSVGKGSKVTVEGRFSKEYGIYGFSCVPE